MTAAPDDPQAAPEPPPRPRLWRRFVRWIWLGLRALVMFCMAAWAVLAVYFSDLSGRPPRTILAATVGAAFVGSLLIRKPRYVRPIAFISLFLIVLGWFFSIRPSNTRDWQPDVAVLPYAVFEGDLVTIHNVRNFQYTAEDQYTPTYDVRTFDLSRVKTVDYILSFWGPKAIAHSMISFGFDDGRYLAISIETRKEKGEVYSAVQGFFRQYELTYVIADERDVLGVRTNFRNEDVYVYRTQITPEHARVMLVDYLKSANELAERPQFYNALTTNCATSILPHIRSYDPTARISLSVIFNGHSAEAAHKRGGLDQSMPFEELQRRSRITDTAKLAGNSPDFSARIREGLPVPRDK